MTKQEDFIAQLLWWLERNKGLSDTREAVRAVEKLLEIFEFTELTEEMADELGNLGFNHLVEKLYGLGLSPIPSGGGRKAHMKRRRRRAAARYPDISMIYSEFQGHYEDQAGGKFDQEEANKVVSELIRDFPTDLGWWLVLLNDIADQDPPTVVSILSAVLPTFKEHLGNSLVETLHHELEDIYEQDTSVHEDYPGQHYPEPEYDEEG